VDKKEVEIDCPCCRSRVAVDVRTGKVLRWRLEQELDASGKPRVRESDWTQAHERVEGRLGSAADKFDAGLAREQGRGRDLDDLFRAASEKLKRGSEGEDAEGEEESG
jgi:hypothetical protein